MMNFSFLCSNFPMHLTVPWSKPLILIINSSSKCTAHLDQQVVLFSDIHHPSPAPHTHYQCTHISYFYMSVLVVCVRGCEGGSVCVGVCVWSMVCVCGGENGGCHYIASTVPGIHLTIKVRQRRVYVICLWMSFLSDSCLSVRSSRNQLYIYAE